MLVNTISTSDLDFPQAEDWGCVSTHALTVCICNMGGTNSHAVLEQPPLQTNFQSLQQKMKYTAAI